MCLVTGVTLFSRHDQQPSGLAQGHLKILRLHVFQAFRILSHPIVRIVQRYLLMLAVAVNRLGFVSDATSAQPRVSLNRQIVRLSYRARASAHSMITRSYPLPVAGSVADELAIGHYNRVRVLRVQSPDSFLRPRSGVDLLVLITVNRSAVLIKTE